MTQLPAEMYYWISVIRGITLMVTLGMIGSFCAIPFCIMLMFEKPNISKFWFRMAIVALIFSIVFTLTWIFLPTTEFIKAYYEGK